MDTISKTFTLKNGDDKKQRIVCRECCRETLHSIISTYSEKGSEDCENGNYVDWNCDNQIIQCLGCESVSFRTVSTFSEDMDFDKNGPFYPKTIKYYPGRAEGLKSIDSYLLPDSIQLIYKETTLAIESGQFILAGIGIRAIVETICKDLNAEGQDLFKKIDSLKAKFIITPDDATILHKLRVLGNDATHEVKAHDSKQLELAINIIVHMLDGAYIIPARVKDAFTDKNGK